MTEIENGHPNQEKTAFPALLAQTTTLCYILTGKVRITKAIRVLRSYGQLYLAHTHDDMTSV